MKWSQSYFPKVLGGVFLLCSTATASQYDAALTAAAQATYIQSGLKGKTDLLKKTIFQKSKEILKEYDVQKEAALLGSTLQTIRDKAIIIRYEGVDYELRINELKVRFCF